MGTLHWMLIIIVLIAVFPPVLYAVDKKAAQKGAAKVFEQLMADAFRDRVERFRALNRRAGRASVLLIGDSLIQEWPHDELFTSKGVLNRGIGGDTTRGVLNRLDASLGSLTPSRVILLIGTNDLVMADIPASKTVANIRQIAEAIRALDPSIEVDVLSLLPINGDVDAFTVGVRKNETIEVINEQLQRHASSYRFHDIHSLFTDKAGRLRADLTRDGLHINVEGYTLLTDHIEQHILN